jgi:colanic acid/amylovoran biosynthesis glycosyltransferase
MKNIIEVSYSSPAEVFVERHLRALGTTGLRVQLVARTYNRNTAVILGSGKTDGVPVQVMPTFDHRSLLARLLISFRYLFAAKQLPNFQRPMGHQVLLAYFRSLNPALIHFHTARYAVMMRWIPETLGVPYTISLRGSDVQVFPLRSAFEVQEVCNALLGATRIHTVCRHLGRVAEQIVGAPLEFDTIYTTVPVPDSLPPYAPDDSTGCHLISVGRIHWTKGLPDLLTGLRTLLDRNVSVRLTIVGSGPDEPRLRYWIKRFGLESHVMLTGKLGTGDIRNWLGSAHAYIQSSIAEGFSNAVAEAMARGCPVFATDVGGTSEIIRDGENGFLLAPLNPESWADKLELARDVRLMNRIRECAYATARRYFSPHIHAEAFIQFYEQSLGCKNARDKVCRADATPLGGAQGNDAYDALSRILIVGRLEWNTGADLVLRALAQVTRGKSARFRRVQPFRIILIGEGEQAEELRYLAQFLDFPLPEIFPGSSLENFPTNPMHPSDIIVRLPEDVCEDWIISCVNGQKFQVPFGNFDQLVTALREVSREQMAVI